MSAPHSLLFKPTYVILALLVFTQELFLNQVDGYWHSGPSLDMVPYEQILCSNIIFSSYCYLLDSYSRINMTIMKFQAFFRPLMKFQAFSRISMLVGTLINFDCQLINFANFPSTRQYMKTN